MPQRIDSSMIRRKFMESSEATATGMVRSAITRRIPTTWMSVTMESAVRIMSPIFRAATGSLLARAYSSSRATATNPL